MEDEEWMGSQAFRERARNRKTSAAQVREPTRRGGKTSLSPGLGVADSGKNLVRKGWEKLRQFTPSGFHFLGEMDTSLPISGKG